MTAQGRQLQGFPTLEHAALWWEIAHEMKQDPAEARRIAQRQEWDRINACDRRPGRRHTLARRLGGTLVAMGERMQAWASAGSTPPTTA